MKVLLLKNLLLILFFSSSGFLWSQTSEDISDNLNNDPRVLEFTMDQLRGTPTLIKLHPEKSSMGVEEVPAFLSEVMENNTSSFITENSLTNNGLVVTKIQQFHLGIKVEHGVFKAVSQNGKVLAITAEYYNLSPELATTPTLTEELALQSAVNFIGATTYAWELVETLEDSPEKIAALEEVSPTGELVYVDNYATKAMDISLAWRFDIYAAEPLSRDDVYVDAATGEILLVDAIIKHANGIHLEKDILETVEKSLATPPSPVFLTGSGDTRYAGNRDFDTSLDTNGNYVLNGVTPSGIENETLSYDGIGGLPLSIPALASLATPIADGDGNLLNSETADNNWTEAEHRKDSFSTLNPYPIANEKNNDDVALDAHWGAEVVLDYWKEKHNRSSYDDMGTKVLNFVHYGDAYDNAFWNGSAMTYGDGSYQGGTNPDGAFAPLTSMDVCAHEIGHGVCEYTADLVYQRESGAMNEGFSDIWAAAVEHYVLSEIDSSLNYDPWGIGEQIDERDGGLQPGDPGARALRWMDDPKAAGAPDSYGGDNWIDPECGTPSLANDQCGVHTNSGVLNKWFYFLVEGSGKAFSPGYQKQSGDDMVSDAGNNYTVEGIGFEKAAQITYLAETMLSPNAKFAEMRATSILVAQSLYGISSPEEEATTNAWYAVDIGEAYNTGEPNTITFNEKNIQLFHENNSVTGCEDFSVYTVQIQGVEIEPAAVITLSKAGSTATLGEDYELSATELSFSGSEIKKIEIKVFDDAVIEDTEVIRLSFVYNGELLEQEYSISNDDFEPRKGDAPFDMLAEEFSGDALPQDWNIVNLGQGVNIWKVNGNLEAAGKAYITEGILDTPFYDQNSPSNIILRSPMLNAAGAGDVTVTFDWVAGGETDALDATTIFDYGEFVYSLDGATYESVQKFVGDGLLAAETASGSFEAVLPELDGKAFFLGWRWYNDTNAGSQYSFSIDNVKVSATPAGIETEANEQATANIHTGNASYFLSDSDSGLIAKIENASADLGCVTVSVIEAGTGSQPFSNISSERPSKVFSINTSNEDATYDLTLYFTTEELSSVDVPAELIPLKVDSSNIDDANDREVNFQLGGVLTEADTEAGYYAFTGTFSGSGSLSVVTEFDFCTSAPEPWRTADVGNTGIAGDLCYLESSFELTAEGAGFTKKNDSFFFAYQEITGDVDLVARLSTLERTGSNAKAAVMLRDGLNADSKFAMTSITANNSLTGYTVNFEYRKGKQTAQSTPIATTVPRYIRIVKKGKDVFSYVSDVEGNWELLGSTNLGLSETLYVGLAATSGASGTTTLAKFEEVDLNTGSELTQQSVQKQEEELTFEGESDSKMATYPNPATNVLNVSIEDAAIVKINLYDLSGKQMKVETFSGTNSTESFTVSGLYNGVYIIKVYTSTGLVHNGRFVKE